MSRYLGFGKTLLVVTNEPEGSPSLQTLFKAVPVKDTVVCSLQQSIAHLKDLERRDVTVVFLLNHQRGSLSLELPREVLERTTLAPLPLLGRNTLLTVCHRRDQNRDLLEAFVAAPDSSRLEKELRRFLSVTEGVPYFRRKDVLYCSVVGSRPEYVQRFISSKDAIEARAFTFADSAAFLQAAGDDSEVYIVDRQDPTPIPDVLVQRMPLNPFTLRSNEAICVATDKGTGERVILYSAPCERFLLPLLAESPPKIVSLPDLSSARALGVSYLTGSVSSQADVDLVQEGSGFLSDALFELCQRKGLAVVERTRFREVAEEIGLQSTGLLDEATVAKVGRLVGAQAIVMGDVLSVRRWTDHILTEWRARDGVREKWAWHWMEKAKGHAEVTLNLRLVDVETATQTWTTTLLTSRDGEQVELRSESRDEHANNKPPPPHWFRTDYSSPGCPDELASQALTAGISQGVEKLEAEALWPSDLSPLSGLTSEGEVLGVVQVVKDETVYVKIEKGIEWLRPGATLYVVEETKVGADIYRKKKATMIVRAVRTESAECTVQSLESGESIQESDLVTSRPEVGSQ